MKYAIFLRFSIIFIATGIIISCNDSPDLSTCETELIGSWKIDEHFIYYEFDTLVGEAHNEFEINFKSNGTGIIERISGIDKFDWTCSDSSVVFMEKPQSTIHFDAGEYNIINSTDSVITLQKYLLTIGHIIGGDSINSYSWRTWILSKQ